MKDNLSKQYDDFFGSLHKSPFKNVPKMKRKRLILKFVRSAIKNKLTPNNLYQRE